MKAVNRVVLGCLRHDRPRSLGRALVGLRLRGRRSGREVLLPVMYAEDGPVLWVAVGRSQSKSWWRNITTATSLEVLMDGSWHHGSADLVPSSDDRHDTGRATYARRWPRAAPGPQDPLVRITLDAEEIRHPRRDLGLCRPSARRARQAAAPRRGRVPSHDIDDHTQSGWSVLLRGRGEPVGIDDLPPA